MQKVRKILLYGAAAGFLFFVLFTLYSLVSVRHLCDLTKADPKTTKFMEMRKEQWEEKKLKRKIDQRWVPLSSISRNLQNAVLAAEDPHFYKHHGLDFYAIWLAFKRDATEMRIVAGASTITQQLMKNLYLSPSQNPLRKWHEAILALRVERCVPKKRILEVYLNVIEWGEATYGIESASRKYFGKSASELDPAESALLAAMIPNPILYNPYKKNATLLKEKNTTLRNMLRLGMISKDQYNHAVNEAIRLR